MTMPNKTATAPERRGWRRGLRLALLPLDVVVAIVLLLDEIARPLYRPLIRLVAGLRLVVRIEAAIARLPPYGVLALIAVPFAVAEPMKLVGLWLMGTGRFVTGLATLIVAYAATFFIVERIYHAGRANLLTIPWFAYVMDAVVRLRDAVMERIRALPLYQAARRFALRARLRLGSWRRRLRRLLA
jgi:hypothetical protein